MIDLNLFPRFKDWSFKIAEQITVWSKAFQVEPGEIERQIAIAHAWCENNKAKAPKKDIMRFLNNWMQIADRKHSLRRGTPKVEPREPDPEPDMSVEELIAIRKANFK